MSILVGKITEEIRDHEGRLVVPSDVQFRLSEADTDDEAINDVTTRLGQGRYFTINVDVKEITT